MAKEGSVAPKERINIVYKPHTPGDEEQELPLKLLMLGDYTLREDDTPIEDRQLVQVDKDNFNDVMREQKLELDMNVSELKVNLKIETLKDFEPERVVRQVPELNKLLELREALVSLKGPLGNVSSFRKRIQTLLDDDEQRKLLDDMISKEK
jgi:type VI secretion system protein ImpB